MTDKKFTNMPKLGISKANQDHFNLTVKGLEGQSVQVLGFKGHEHRFSGDYRFEVNVQVQHALAIKDYIGSPAQLSMRWDAEEVYINGIISEVSHLGKRIDVEELNFIISSPLHTLRFNTQSRIFLNKNVKTIIEDVLLGAGLLSSDFTFQIKGTYPKREFTVQYNESDYDFIQRMMAHYGLFFMFEQTNKQAILQIVDSIEDMPTLPGGGELLFNANTGSNRPIESVFSLNQHGKFNTEYVRLKDYNYRTPEVGLLAESKATVPIKGKGVDYCYAENYKTLDEGDYIAKIRQETLDWQRETYVARSDVRGLGPGMKFTLIGHDAQELNGDYLVVEVEHKGDQRAGQGYGAKNKGRTYENTVMLIRAGIPYRAPLTQTPKAPGVFSARVETTGGDYAYLDEQGRYHIRMPFDLSDMAEGTASHPVRMAQPYTGNKYGMHFPLHAGTEVAVVCSNGDLDRPIILGAVTNPDTMSTTTATNHSQNTLRTWGGNELMMEDRRGYERVEMFTRDRQNILKLDANQEGHNIELGTEQGTMKQYAKKTMLLESGDSQTVQVGNDQHVLVQNSQHLMTKNKQIHSHSATDTKYEAGDHILMQAEKEDFRITSAKDMVVDVDKNLSMEVRNKNLEVQVTTGKTSIQAAKAITFKGDGGGMIHVGQSGGVIEVSTGGDLTVDGKSITVNAPMINIRGNAVGNN